MVSVNQKITQQLHHFLVSHKMNFFDINQAKTSEYDVKIASDKMKSVESGGVLSTEPTNPVDRPYKSKPSGKFTLETPPYKTNGCNSMRK